jgi:uncharacterized protein (DUF433 family)
VNLTRATQRYSPEAVVELYRSGRFLPQIAEDLGIPMSRAYRDLCASGIPRRGVGGCRWSSEKIARISERNERIVEQFRAGRLRSHLARDYGISKEGISKILGRAGIPRAWKRSPREAVAA